MLCCLLNSSDNLVEPPEDRVFVVTRKLRIIGKGSPSPSRVTAGALFNVPYDSIDVRIV